MVDVLHTVDLGLGAHIVGNVFWRCVTLRAWGERTAPENMAKLEEELAAWYRRRKEKSQLQGKLTIQRVRTSKGWPKLKAKGAATRHIAEFALDLARMHLLPSSDQGRMEFAVIQCLVNFYRILESEGRWLSTSGKNEIAKLGRQLSTMYAQLARRSLDAGEKFWL